jgi:arylsulfatase A-like enzyme
MKRRNFLKGSALAATAASIPYPSNAKGVATGDVPNILFINVDQMSLLDSIRAYGCEYTSTPGIDRLVQNGTSFMQSYSTDPVCCPARASWWTGAYSSEHGVVCNTTPCHAEMPDLSRLLQEAGYNTYFSGKWHVPGKQVRKLFHVLHEGSWWGEITDAEVTRSAASFLQNYNGSQPFFLNVGYLNPHDICITPDYDSARSSVTDGKKVPPYEAAGVLEESDIPPVQAAQDYDPREPGILVACKRGSARKENAAFSDWSDELWRMHRYNYHRFTEMVDAQIDQLLDALEQSSFRDNTLIIFSSDHGEGIGRHRTVAKSTFYDEVCRVPFVVATLGSLKVRKSIQDDKHLVSGIDLGRTVCDYARADGAVLSHGKSLRPLVEGRDVPWREFVYAENSAYMHMVTDGTIKYVCEYIENDEFTGLPPSAKTHRTGVEQLFDMKRDPNEGRNLAYDPEYKPQLERMRKALDQLEGERVGVKAVAPFAQQFMKQRSGAIKKNKIPQKY